MTVFNIGIFAFAALVIGRLGKSRELALLGVSVFFVYWLQPSQNIVSFAYWIPTATLALVILCWLFVSTPEIRDLKQNWQAALVIVGSH